MYYRARTYDPETGRFMQQDPVGYADGMNLYEYVMSNPLAHFDPLGLTTMSSDGGGGETTCPGLIMDLKFNPTEEDINKVKNYITSGWAGFSDGKGVYKESFEYGEGTVSSPFISTSFAQKQLHEKADEFRDITERGLNRSREKCCDPWVCEIVNEYVNKRAGSRKRWTILSISRNVAADDFDHGNPVSGLFYMHRAWDVTYNQEFLGRYRYNAFITCTRKCEGPYKKTWSPFNWRQTFWAVESSETKAETTNYGKYKAGHCPDWIFGS